MVCSPHIGVLAGIASGGARNYNSPLRIPSYQQSPLYNRSYQSIGNGRQNYQPRTIGNTLYNFQKSKDNNQLSTIPENALTRIPRITEEKKIVYGFQEQTKKNQFQERDYLNAMERVAYQNPILALLAQAYIAQVEKVLNESVSERVGENVSKNSSENANMTANIPTMKSQLQQLIEEELQKEEVQMPLHHHHV
ncbi:hypothetical protein HYX13_00400 [Candidatus Woesearchaeota archaeon]|nr:hypothetical protein [Candidatus Woesearchaeota archaeon]